MTGLLFKVVARFLGEPGPSGRARVLAGLRTRDRRELATGLALLGLAYLRSSNRPKKELVYRRVLDEGDALLIRNADPDARRIDRKQLKTLKRQIR